MYTDKQDFHGFPGAFSENICANLRQSAYKSFIHLLFDGLRICDNPWAGAGFLHTIGEVGIRGRQQRTANHVDGGFAALGLLDPDEAVFGQVIGGDDFAQHTAEFLAATLAASLGIECLNGASPAAVLHPGMFAGNAIETALQPAGEQEIVGMDRQYTPLP